MTMNNSKKRLLNSIFLLSAVLVVSTIGSTEESKAAIGVKVKTNTKPATNLFTSSSRFTRNTPLDDMSEISKNISNNTPKFILYKTSLKPDYPKNAKLLLNTSKTKGSEVDPNTKPVVINEKDDVLNLRSFLDKKVKTSEILLKSRLLKSAGILGPAKVKSPSLPRLKEIPHKE